MLLTKNIPHATIDQPVQLAQPTGFKELALVYGSTEKSYRKTSDLMNTLKF